MLLILLVLYAAAVQIVGYTVSTPFFFVICLRVAGVRLWSKSVLFGLAFTAAFIVGFSFLAQIPLP